MIYEQIKKDNIQAMKDKNVVARSLFSVVMNKIKLEEIRKREKALELVDADVIAILQKTVKELEEEKANFAKVGNMAQVEAVEKQIKIVESYLPQMMNDEEIMLRHAVRSSVGSAREWLVKKMALTADICEAALKVSGVYPAWEYRRDSRLREDMVWIYEQMFADFVEIAPVIFGDDRKTCMTVKLYFHNYHSKS